MWKSIKKFFKWIADHTGISWVARKISSGWKWLFGDNANADHKDTSQLGKSSEPETPDDKPIKTHTPNEPTTMPDEPQEPVINTSETDAKELPENFSAPNLKNENYLKVSGKDLLLVLTLEQFAKCKENSESTNLNALLMYIKCDANEYRFTGNSVSEKIILIKSIRKKNENGQFKEISAKEILGDAIVKKVDSISNKPFGAPTLEQPNPNVTSHNVTQQVVSNETEVKQASGSTTADPAVEQSTPVSSSKAPTNGTLPKVASPSETKNGSNNGAVVLYQMLHDQGRLHPSPELYDYLLRASLVKEMLFCKVAPNSSFTQSIAEQAAGNDHSR